MKTDLQRLFLVLVLIFGGVNCGRLCAAGDVTKTARQLLAMGGSTNGFCCVLNCGDGALATALAQNSEWVVFALDPRPDRVAAAQAMAHKTGLVGKRLYVDAGAPAAIPLTTDYADLLVVEGLSDLQLATLASTELARVLSPRLGKLIIGHPAGVAGLTRGKLEAWFNRTGLVDVKIVDDATGLWAMARKPPRKGADDWSNWQHGPDNNPLSQDTAYGYPDAVQWLNRPFQTGPGFSIAAGGRYFSGYNPDVTQSECGPGDGPEMVTQGVLYAWQGYNGRSLWSRLIDGNYTWHRIWVATPDRFYLAEGNAIVVLAAANGQEIMRIPAGDNNEQIIWMTIADNTAFILTGAKSGKRIESGTRLAAFDLMTRKPVWEHRESTPIDYTSVGLANGRIYFAAPATRVAALDCKTGRECWANSKILIPEDGDANAKPLGKPTNALLLCPTGAVVVSFGNMPTRVLAFAPGDGRILWRRSRNVGESSYALVVDNRLISNQFGETGIDLLTGGNPDKKGINGGCGRCTATPNYFVNQFGVMLDAARAHALGSGYSKDICGIGQFVANGLRYGGAPGSCHCNLSFRGILAWNRADDQTTLSPDGPLEVIDPSEPAAVDITEADWTQYRRDAPHSSSSPVAVGSKSFVNKWLHQPAAPFLPTPVTAVGDQLFFSGSDGLVQGLEAETGKSLWTFPTSGRVLFQPTVAENRLLVGSSDGRVYCLAAKSGKLLWRFRPGPASNRLLVYDELMSRWSVNANIAVQDGVAYVLSGLMDCDGVAAHALDLHTGKVRWTNSNLGSIPVGNRAGQVPMGAMTVAGNWLWFRSDKGTAAAVDIRTGALQATPLAYKNGTDGVSLWGDGYVGKDIGLLGGRYLMEGGRRLYCPQSDRTLNVNNSVNLTLELDRDGVGVYPRIALEKPGEVFFPSWDNEICINPYAKNWRMRQSLNRYAITNLVQALDEKKKTCDRKVMRAKVLTPPASTWAGVEYFLNSLVICKDAVLITEGRNKTSQKSCVLEEWHLTALNRDTGAQLWSVVLPAEPIFDGLTVDRAGRAILAFADGRIGCYGR